MRGRLNGGKSKNPHYWAGIGNEFFDWAHFRRWALKNGYRKGMSLDRINPYRGYAPDNCQFITVAEHARKSQQHATGCPCGTCRLQPPRPFVPLANLPPGTDCPF